MSFAIAGDAPVATAIRIQQSAIDNPKSVDPLVGLLNEDGQLFHHVLSLSDRADHAHARGRTPFLRHALASMATPTLGVGATRKIAPINFTQLVFVQPRFTGAINVVAVIEHETGPV